MSVINPLGKDMLKRFGNLMILFFPPMSQIDPLTMACKPLIAAYGKWKPPSKNVPAFL